MKYLRVNKKVSPGNVHLSKTTRKKISILLYCKHNVICGSAERFNLHTNAASRLRGAAGEELLSTSNEQKGKEGSYSPHGLFCSQKF